MAIVLYIVFFIAAWISLFTANVHLATSFGAGLFKKDYGTYHRKHSHRMVLVHFGVTFLLFWLAYHFAEIAVYS